MKTFYRHGAMYAVVNSDEIEVAPIELGDGILYPGEFVQKLGQGSPTFTLDEGYYLRYVGMTMENENKLLLFGVNHYNYGNLYYTFYYLRPSTLFWGGIGFGRTENRMLETMGKRKLEEVGRCKDSA